MSSPPNSPPLACVQMRELEDMHAKHASQSLKMVALEQRLRQKSQIEVNFNQTSDELFAANASRQRLMSMVKSLQVSSSDVPAPSLLSTPFLSEFHAHTTSVLPCCPFVRHPDAPPLTPLLSHLTCTPTLFLSHPPVPLFTPPPSLPSSTLTNTHPHTLVHLPPYFSSHPPSGRHDLHRGATAHSTIKAPEG